MTLTTYSALHLHIYSFVRAHISRQVSFDDLHEDQYAAENALLEAPWTAGFFSFDG